MQKREVKKALDKQKSAEKKIRKVRKKVAKEEHEKEEETIEETKKEQEKEEEAVEEAMEEQEDEEEAVEEATEEQEKEEDDFEEVKEKPEAEGTDTAEKREKMKKMKMEEVQKEPEEVTAQKKKRMTPLLRATAAGLVATAQRPFAMYCKEMGLRVQDASQGWKKLSSQEKNTYIEKSKNSFLQQRRESAAAGVSLRKTQLQCTAQGDEAAAQNKLLKSSNKKGPFASFCEETGQSVLAATRRWKSMTKAQKASYTGLSEAEALRAMPGQEEDPSAAEDLGLQSHMVQSGFVNRVLNFCQHSSTRWAGSLHGCSAQSNCFAIQLL